MTGAPEPLSANHDIAEFDCGVATLNTWLQRRAAANQVAGASRTFVICEYKKVVGYYALATGAITAASATGRFRRNMPELIPVVVLGRLAVATTYRGHGLGRALFRDAALRVLQVADSVGIRGLLVHALSEDAKAFYLGLGLLPSPVDPMALMVTLADLRLSLFRAAKAV